MSQQTERKLTERDLYAHIQSVFASIDKDILGPLQYHEHAGGGFFSITALCFLTIEYLGSLIYDHQSTPLRAQMFLHKYMGAVDCRYRYYQSLLVDMWRNGIIHEHDPKHYTTTYQGNTVDLHWSLNNSSRKENREQHLRCIKKLKLDKEPDTYVLHINLFALVDDLKAALDILLQDLIDNKKTINYPNPSQAIPIRRYVLETLGRKVKPRRVKQKNIKDSCLRGQIQFVLHSHDPDEYLDPSRLWVRRWSEMKP